MNEKYGLSLTFRERGDRCCYRPIAFRRDKRSLGIERRVGKVDHHIARDLASTTQLIAAQIEHDRVQPGIEPRTPRLPAAGLPPDPYKRFLGDILRFGGIAQHAVRQTDEARELARDEQARRGRIAA